MKITTIAQTYVSSFPSDWIERLDWSTEEKSKESFINGRNRIDEFIGESFCVFCTSSLSGEYVVKELDTSLNEFQKVLFTDYPPDIENPFKSKLYNFFQELGSDLLLIVKRYKALIQMVSDKISRANHDYIVSAFVSNKDQCSNRSLSDVVDYCFPLCLKDHFLKFANDDIRELLLIREDIETKMESSNVVANTIYQALYEKCSFLLKKCVHIKGEAEYVLNFEAKKLITDSIEIKLLRKLDTHFTSLHITERHLRDDDFDSRRRRCQTRNTTFTDFVLLMRYYVKSGGSKQEIDSLIEDFDACIDIFNVKRPFDRYAVNSLKNYMANSQLSVLLSKRHIQYGELKRKLSEIDDLQEQTRIYNFHPYEKAIDFLLADIDHDLNEGNNKQLVEEKTNFLEQCYENFKKNIKWCQGQDYYPFQLPYWECLHKTDNNIILFIPSSFTKPLNYLELGERYSEYTTKVSTIKEQLRIWDDKQEILELKEQLSGHQKTYIQILGLFTAIVTFLFGTVNIFSAENKNSLHDKINDTAVLGILLLIFASLIYILIQPRKEKIFTIRNIVFVGMIIGYFVLLFIFYS